jgi:transcriptional regulator with XRE-family HTH domain
VKKIKGLADDASIVDRYSALRESADGRRGLPELASALLQLRSRVGMTQAQLAQAAGVPTTLISELENVRNEGVTWRTLVRLAQGAGAGIEIRFHVDPTRDAAVDVLVDGDYLVDDELVVSEVEALIQEQNRTMLALGALAA